MSISKEIALENIRSVGSGGHLDIKDHEINLNAVASATLGLAEVGQALTFAQKDLIVRRLDLGGLISLDDLPLTASFMIEKIERLSIEESLDILKDALVYLENDVNIPIVEYEFYETLVQKSPVSPDHSDSSISDKFGENEKIKVVVKDKEIESASIEGESSKPYSPYDLVDWELQVRLEAGLIAYHSPYLEVRSVTDPYDDPTVPVETLRVYFLGLIWVCLLGFLNEFFNDRLPGISLNSSAASMLVYPMGVFLAKVVPKYTIKIWKYEIPLNPGPWTYKEQVLASLIYGVGGGGNYVSSNITAQKLSMFYGNTWVTKGYQALLILSTNFMGLGFAGVLRKFVIYPADAVWPTLLPDLALIRALLVPEKKENINGWTISRYNFFFTVAGSSFLYFWIPNYLFNGLQTFSWMTWISPNNFNLAAVTGSQFGLGLNPFPSFDWNIAGQGALNQPFYTTLSNYIGALIGFVCIIGVYYTNYKWTAYLPINTNQLFSNEGEYYIVKEVLNENSLFDQEKYDNYGPPFYSAANLVTYGSFFALYPFAIIHEVSMTFKPIVKALKGLYYSIRHWKRSNYEGFTDPHSTMMRKYKEVPDWAFYIILVLSVVFAILAVELFPTNTPVWGIFFSLAINFVFLIPITTLYARTGFSFALNVLVELIIGYALPGNGIALMTIKALGTEISVQAQDYITDQKMGHYAKLPPRAMFRVQLLGVLVGGFVSMAALNFKLDHFHDYCQPHQRDRFTCPGTNTFFASSVIWGVVGPRRVFDGLYPILKWCFLIGFLLSFPCIAIKYYGPPRYVKYFQPSIIIGGFLSFSPYNLTYLTGQLYLSTAIMWYIKGKYSAFWSKYNYVFSSAMAVGIAFSGLIIFFAVQYHPKNLSWWGNNIIMAGVDGGSSPQQSLLNASLADGGYFGPRIGHFP